MPPELGWNSGIDSPDWGQGMEQFNSSSIPQAAKQWYEETKLPRIITPESLAGAPVPALALLRAIARYPLLDGISIGKPEIHPAFNPKVNEVMKCIQPNSIEVGNIYTEPWDNDRTENVVLPLITDKGTIEITVSGAWGVGWRLAKNHPMVDLYPQLARVQNQDLSEPPVVVNEEKAQESKYLSPDVLAQATMRTLKLKPKKLAKDIKKFIKTLSKQDDFKISVEKMPAPTTLIERFYHEIRFTSLYKKWGSFTIRHGNILGVKDFDVFNFKLGKSGGKLMEQIIALKILPG